jgi:hypothetical protein
MFQEGVSEIFRGEEISSELSAEAHQYTINFKMACLKIVGRVFSLNVSRQRSKNLYLFHSIRRGFYYSK